ncbi:hypothetical protein JKP88DRAFT_347880 [Tribonema minus]|uniref:Uncharacterized protein n=1 Tax=Tribonema minus TaxID=303371 RepID=A0A836CKH2_9STRA|nr:hypothetical protein JKP88DRAFT_347880 [Tribonema minus]
MPREAWDLSKSVRAESRPRVVFELREDEESEAAYCRALTSKRIVALTLRDGAPLPSPLPARGVLRQLVLTDGCAEGRPAPPLEALGALAAPLDLLSLFCCCDAAWAHAALARLPPRGFAVGTLEVSATSFPEGALRGFAGSAETLRAARRGVRGGVDDAQGLDLDGVRARRVELRGALYPARLPRRARELTAELAPVLTPADEWRGALSLRRLRFVGCRFPASLALPPGLESLTVVRSGETTEAYWYGPTWREGLELRLVASDADGGGTALPPALSLTVRGYRVVDAPPALLARWGAEGRDRWDLVDLTGSDGGDDAVESESDASESESESDEGRAVGEPEHAAGGGLTDDEAQGW